MSERTGVVGLDLRYAVAARLRVGVPKDTVFEARQRGTLAGGQNNVEILDFGFWILDCIIFVQLRAGSEQTVMIGYALLQTRSHIGESSYLRWNVLEKGTHL